MVVVGEVINFVLWACILLLLARFVIDWVQVLSRSWQPKGFVLVFCEAIYSVTDPPMRAVRRVIPPIRFGGMALDLSPMVLLIGLYLLQIINAQIFFR
ncbi:YggT family protein [Mumia sp. zg.B17]|uniref:YggT family protein n=1 Tax=unclassified Mumia TaxID=2621872 RepID=UPI001C6DE53E|nr:MULTISPECIES: YggT family protein [unclassified Mumia]MBW9206226.1 YggT family protein [Mumia sp. zg.B17]MDD9349755.1 YggT family protein [Mumia sp.]